MKIFRILSLTQYDHTEEDSDRDTDSDISRGVSEGSSVCSYQLRKKDTAMKNIVRRNYVVDTQELEESFKISKNYKKYGTSARVKKTNWTEVTKTVENKRYYLRSDNDETFDSIEQVT